MSLEKTPAPRELASLNESLARMGGNFGRLADGFTHAAPALHEWAENMGQAIRLAAARAYVQLRTEGWEQAQRILFEAGIDPSVLPPSVQADLGARMAGLGPGPAPYDPHRYRHPACDSMRWMPPPEGEEGVPPWLV